MKAFICTGGGAREVRAMQTVLIVCAMLNGAAVAVAAPEPGSDASAPLDSWTDMISPDRPGAATPPSVVDRGVFQIETSFESQTVRAPDAAAQWTGDFPTLLRLGIGHAVEIRLESNTASFEPAVTGFSDVSVEAKWLTVNRHEGAVPSVALLPAVTLPTGTSDFTGGKVQAGLSSLLGWTLASGTSLSFDAVASRVVQSSDSPYVWQLGSQAAFQTPLRRDWAISGDAYVSAPLVSGSASPWGVDAGIEYYPNPETQLDLVVIHTLTEPGSSTALQLGYSRRIGPGGSSQ
jgi:hypothetical protein